MKIRRRPDLFRKVLNRAKNEGLLDTYHRVVCNLVEPIPGGVSLEEAAFKRGRLYDAVGLVGQGFCRLTIIMLAAPSGLLSLLGLMSGGLDFFANIGQRISSGSRANQPNSPLLFGALGAIRTRGLRLRRPLLCPAELRGRWLAARKTNTASRTCQGSIGHRAARRGPCRLRCGQCSFLGLSPGTGWSGEGLAAWPRRRTCICR